MPKQCPCFLNMKSLVIWLATLTLICVLTYYSIITYGSFNDNNVKIDSNNIVSNAYLINTSGCRIPEMFTRGPTIDKFLDTDPEVDCTSPKHDSRLKGFKAITSDETDLIINPGIWAKLNLSKNDPSLTCYYEPVSRPKPTASNKEDTKFDNDFLTGMKKQFKDRVTVTDEFVKAWCMLESTEVYRSYHGFVIPKSSTAAKQDDGKVSVLVIGLDGISRLNFNRQMPKTAELLSKFGVVEMLGYNKMEYNTFPNLVATLSGHSVPELAASCWPKQEAFFDDCSFVWDTFKRAGYETGFGEDSPLIGAFNFQKNGFHKQPTDRYIRPMMVAAENDIGHNSPLYTDLCIGDSMQMTFLLDYVRKFVRSTDDHLSFGFFWSTSLTHDYLNIMRHGDECLRDFFEFLDQSGHLNKTAVVLMSDHGLRFGPFRDTYQGSLEDRLPMLRLILPKWFKAKYQVAMQNLRVNVDRLTTPYDTHKTLLDFLDLKQLEDNAVNRRPPSRDLGHSLFTQVPENRTCESAGIPMHYCACHNKVISLETDDSKVERVASALVDHINVKLKTHPQCEQLKLHKIVSASKETGGGNGKLEDFVVQVITTPGEAKFEATVRYTENNLQLIGSISRQNLYGNQSICVNGTETKLLCFCKNTTESVGVVL
ncbi:uncharacterized protein LOC126844248 [Adelges cooleyi]|uniref:uncharacterized protein LOC126844248 n=1 Tax=Adelges cooleyi TaxID=133065 RepID=UPI00218043D1|nr:uncharacterized protein LOC126844248 [Adelges cooleyi]XP_050438240.1 uncharacterized protein LOC126844248 [Adelges cooleyi]XP_050438241.1 uncharacterized protein LOC126844248 [Adelges cooleyi]